jgi:DNA (cytosine-5)-methyltransferase 1
MQTVAFCEIEPFCRAVLRKHWPDVPQYDDVRTLTAERLSTDGIRPDVICGGFPCQDISLAGKGAGLSGERSGLWFELHRIIKETNPKYAVIENVSALRSRGLDEVLRSLTEIGYDSEWHCIPASAIGGSHRRDRVWIVAYPMRQGGQRLVKSINFSQIGQMRWRGKEDLQSIAESPFSKSDMWPQPLLRRGDDGLSGRMDRTRAIGNAVYPGIPEIIGRAIMQAEMN